MPVPIRRAIVALSCAAVFGAGCRRSSSTEHVERGKSYFEQARYQNAILEYRMALQADPKLGDVRLKLGDAYLRANEPANGLREYIRAADLLPNSVDAQVKAGQMLLVARAYEDARTRADKALALDPKSVDAQVLRGNALAGLKDFDAAVSEYQDAIALDPSQAAAYSNLATIQMVQGKRVEAEETFKKAVAAAPQSVAAHLALANFFWATGNPESAEAELKATLQLDVRDSSANRALGLFYMASGRVPEAEPYFKALAKFTPTETASLALADYYTVAKRPNDARKVLRNVATHDQGFATATVRLAALDAADGDRAQAQDRLHEVLQKHPKDPRALLLSARISVADGKRDEARRAVAAVIANEPNSQSAAQAYLLSGQIEALSDRIAEAIAAYEHVLKLQPRPWAANLALARLYLSQGNTDKASTYAQQALAIQPSNTEGQNLLIRAAIASGNLP